MGQRISGKNFTINVGDTLIHVESASLDIEDNTQAIKNRGIPNGHVDGDVSANGELELDSINTRLLIDLARKVGSFRAVKPVDIVFYADTGEDSLKVEAFGCKLKLASLLDIDSNGGEKHKTKVPYDVTSPDFVRINGVPYLDSAETEGL